MGLKNAIKATIIIFQNFNITAKKPTLVRIFPATKPPIVHAATSSKAASKSLYLSSS
jgi:hypothetical protein